jgi:hypothetical protein
MKIYYQQPCSLCFACLLACWLAGWLLANCKVMKLQKGLSTTKNQASFALWLAPCFFFLSPLIERFIATTTTYPCYSKSKKLSLASR